MFTTFIQESHKKIQILVIRYIITVDVMYNMMITVNTMVYLKAAKRANPKIFHNEKS